LLGVALVAVLAYALFTTEKEPPPEPTTACNDANQAFNRGLYSTASALYAELLEEDPTLTCALDGAAAIGNIRCLQAQQLYSEGRDETAAKLLEESLLNDPGKGCLQSADPTDRPIAEEPQSNLAGWARDAIDFVGDRWSWITPPWLDRFGGWLARQLGPLEIVIAAALALALLRHVLRLARLRRTPIVEVGDLVNATGDEKLDKSIAGYSAQLRTRLSDAGISPPTIPGGNAQESAISAIAASPLPQGTFVAPFIKFVLDQASPSAGHKVSGTLAKREDDKCGVTLVISDVYEGQTELTIATWEDDFEEAIEVSAAKVYKHVIAELPEEAAIPAWRRWTGSDDSMRLFYRAKDAEQRGELDSALEDYEAVEKEEPANALSGLQRGYILAEQGHQIPALKIYLRIVLFWPRMIRARDRLAATYSFVLEWWDDWGELEGEEAVELRSAIEAVEGQGVPRAPTKDWFLGRSVDQYRNTLELVDEEIERERRQRLWVMRPLYRLSLWWPRLFPTKLASIRELERQGLTTTVARICTDLQRQIEQFDERERQLDRAIAGRVPIITKRFKRWKVSWQVHYNAACFYSRAFAAGRELASNGRPTLDKALDHLAKAMDHPSSQLSPGWLCGDPDLEALRQDQRGAFLKEHCAAGGPPLERSRKMIRRLRLAWVLLGLGSDRRHGDWTSRKADIARWTGVQGRDLEGWCQSEKDTWGRLVHWAERPEDEGRQLEFWKTLLKSEEKKELPELELPKDGPVGDEAEHRAAWASLADCAATQRDRWDRLEDAVREANMRGESALNQSSAVALAELAQERWLALKDWAEGPIDEGPGPYFMFKAQCADPEDLLLRFVQSLLGSGG
jgi:tetratricopeptide (TPR) repeat protein